MAGHIVCQGDCLLARPPIGTVEGNGTSGHSNCACFPIGRRRRVLLGILFAWASPFNSPSPSLGRAPGAGPTVVPPLGAGFIPARASVKACGFVDFLMHTPSVVTAVGFGWHCSKAGSQIPALPAAAPTMHLPAIFGHLALCNVKGG
jgi:hypothetical protein